MTVELIIDHAREEDAETLGLFFHDDMVALGSPTDLDAQRAMARAMITESQEGTRSVWCLVARTEERGEPAGVLLANTTWSPKFAARSLWIETLYVPRHDVVSVSAGRSSIICSIAQKKRESQGSTSRHTEGTPLPRSSIVLSGSSASAESASPFGSSRRSKRVRRYRPRTLVLCACISSPVKTFA